MCTLCKLQHDCVLIVNETNSFVIRDIELILIYVRKEIECLFVCTQKVVKGKTNKDTLIEFTVNSIKTFI